VNQRCVLITAPGGPEVLQVRRRPIPEVGDDEVLIRVSAAGVNRHDCNQRRRGPTPQHSDVPGLEVAGTVVKVGRAVGDCAVGQAVCALVDGGGYAQFALAKAGQVLPMPPGLSALEAATLPEAAFTVWHNFFRIARLGPGQSVLIHGGTSGVGVMAIQLLSALGHPVHATCGSADKVAVALRLGVTAACNYRQDHFAEEVLRHTGGHGVDAILDMSGGRHTERNLEALARRGHLIHLSPGDGARFDAPLRALMAKEARITGSLLRPLPDSEKALIAADLKRVLWPLLAQGRVRPVVHACFPLEEAHRAHALMEQGEHIGKIVLAVDAGRGPLP
jgi:putative PIG3 family NAD(P)H quinone oxidoreductase